MTGHVWTKPPIPGQTAGSARAAAANTAAMTADNTCQASTTVEYRLSASAGRPFQRRARSRARQRRRAAAPLLIQRTAQLGNRRPGERRDNAVNVRWRPPLAGGIVSPLDTRALTSCFSRSPVPTRPPASYLHAAGLLCLVRWPRTFTGWADMPW